MTKPKSSKRAASPERAQRPAPAAPAPNPPATLEEFVRRGMRAQSAVDLIVEHVSKGKR